MAVAIMMHGVGEKVTHVVAYMDAHCFDASEGDDDRQKPTQGAMSRYQLHTAKLVNKITTRKPTIEVLSLALAFRTQAVDGWLYVERSAQCRGGGGELNGTIDDGDGGT